MRRTTISFSSVASLVIASAAITFAPLSASAQQKPAESPAAYEPPAGWTVLLDEKDAGKTAADTKFVTMGQGFHVTSGPAALYFGKKDVGTGMYTVKATFGQRVRPAMGHPEAYGVFIGGSMLDDYAKQQYFYLVVRDDGQFYVAHRAGKDVHAIVPWTAHDAVKKANDAGAASNEVAIRVTADGVDMMVNGTTVKSFAKSELHGFNTDGQYGLRVNHGLNVHISNFGIQK